MAPVFLPLRPSAEDERLFMDYLKELYLGENSVVRYGSPAAILQAIRVQNKYVNVGLKRLKRYMGFFESYSLNRVRHVGPKARTRRYVAHVPFYQYETDLLDISRFSKFNSGYMFILSLIDVFSKFGYMKPLRDKTASTVVEAFKSLLDELPPGITWIHSDLGSEYRSRAFVALLHERGIKQTYAAQSTSGSVVERFQRSLRSLFRTYRIEHNTMTFVSAISELVNLYNSRVHSTTKTAPRDVTSENAGLISDQIYGKWKERDPQPYKFALEQSVRISTKITAFAKHEHNYSVEIFTIASRTRRDVTNIYTLSSCSEPIEGYFYEHDLTAVYVGDKLFQIDQFIDEKKINGVPHVLVKFKGYPNDARCNKWLKKSDVVDV